MSELMNLIKENDWLILVLGIVIVFPHLIFSVDLQEKSGTASNISPEEYGALSPEEKLVAVAKDHLKEKAFSALALRKQLVADGYSEEDAQYAVDHCGADWTRQAMKAAHENTELNKLNREAVKNYLLHQQFTEEEADKALAFIYISYYNLIID